MDASEEITRLRALNAELVAALEALVKCTEDDFDPSDFQQLWMDARAAIAKAKGET